jgi:pimeloyl-ACP methyl ester carboxylesterase
MSSVRFAPVTGQQQAWKRLGSRPDRTLIFAGRTDPIIFPRELRPDAEALLGPEKVEWRLIDGAHDFPITESQRVVKEICAFWGM